MLILVKKYPAPVLHNPKTPLSATLSWNSALLVCIVSANPLAYSVVWKKTSGSNTDNITIDWDKYWNGDASVPSLRINDLSVTDTGIYVCEATNTFGSGQSTGVTLTVIDDRPNVTVGSASYHTIVGTNVNLQCTVTSSRSITNVFWQRGINDVISVLTIDNVKYSGGSLALPSLTIISTQISDSGTYTCFGSNSIGIQSATTQLTVISGVPIVTISQAAYTVVAGQTVTLECTVSASPPHTSVDWQRIDSGVTTALNIDGIKYFGSTVTSPSLTITSASSDDASNYTCSATNSVGTGISGQTTLTVTGNIPVVTVDKAQYSVITGQTITLGCTVTASPGHTNVLWQKRLHGTTMNVNIDGNKYQGSSVVNPDLTVTNTAVSDQGSYTCSATNIVGTGTSTPTILTVTGIIAGQTVTLGCTVSASPPHTSVYWQRIHSGVTSTLIIDGIKYFGSTATSPSLTITSSSSNDASVYTCSATNAVGTGTSGQTTLTVTDIPVVTVDQAQYSVITGQALLSAVPWQPHRATQVCSGQKLRRGTTMNNIPVVTVDQAQYSVITGQTITLGCTVTASPGHTSVFWQKRLHDVPFVTISQAAYTVTAGQTVTLGCIVSASPPHTSVYWQRIHSGVATTLNIDGIKYSGSTVSSPSLTITSASSNDASDYTCSATNAVGTGTSGQTTLTVTDIPVVTVDQPQYSVITGQAITLGCTVAASPGHTSVFWQKIRRGTTMNVNIDGNKYQGSSVVHPDLTVTNTSVSDQGSYTCSATNLVGTGTSTPTTLTVTGSVPTVTISQAAYTVITGQTVTLGCTVSASPPHTSVYWQRIDSGVTITLNIDGIKYFGSTVTSPSLTITSASSIPAVLVPQTTYEVTTGAAVTLICNVNANPTAQSVLWEKLHEILFIQVVITTNNRYAGGTVNVPSLTITDSQPPDSGTYRCSATNSVGTGTSGTLQLTVTGDGTRPIIDSFMDGTRPIIDSFMDGTSSIIDSFMDGTRSIIDSFMDGTRSIIDSFMDGTSSIIDSFMDGTRSIIDSFMDGTRPIIDSFMDGTSSIIDSFMDGTRSIIDSFMDGTSSIIDSFMDGTSSIIDSFMDGTRSIIDSFMDGTRSIIDSFMDGTRSIIDSFMDGTSRSLTRLWTGLGRSLTRLWTGLGRSLTRLWTGLFDH
ncbi:basement membrane-specific heparan sulfate proteoglycan core protein-like [Argopecten irradians]|uniref:basement membrane-specific heparan sulfate proteoglycan core protein-like n=1 Tax=Argopecten irradians TaxID=31199 RepID=UPI00371004B0